MPRVPKKYLVVLMADSFTRMNRTIQFLRDHNQSKVHPLMSKMPVMENIQGRKHSLRHKASIMFCGSNRAVHE